METISDKPFLSPRQVAEALRKYGAKRCVLMPNFQPTDEIWIEQIGCYIRLTDLSYSWAGGTERHYPGMIGKWFLRPAVKNWRAGL